jgi:O-phosphoseryl-tRNA(Cys) synthetase
LKLWEELDTKFECSVKEAKEKVKNLSTTFHRYRKKKSGSAKGDQWVHFSNVIEVPFAHGTKIFKQVTVTYNKSIKNVIARYVPAQHSSDVFFSYSK